MILTIFPTAVKMFRSTKFFSATGINFVKDETILSMMCFHAFLFLFLFQVVINLRIVVVGSSTVGLSALETFVFW